jgi:peptide/nickel transport system ATP-binding protein
MSPEARQPPIIDLQNVSKRFIRHLGLSGKIANLLGANMHEEIVQAVDTISLAIKESEVFGLVGESGCGKSTLGRIVNGNLTPNEGQVFYRGQDISGLRRKERKTATLKVQMVFQDPFSSLNPRLRIRDIIGEAPYVHGIVSRRELDSYVDEQMSRVGLDPSWKRRYPHQFSGGQRQRICIARALAVNPEFLVCDEAVAALDVSIQAQVLNLLMRLREELRLTYLFISHDLGVVEHISDRAAVMYLGRLVEVAPVEDLFRHPNHPYTQALLAEIPRVGTGRREFAPIRGEIPSPLEPPSGCHFHPRCPHAMDRCRAEVPLIKEVAPNHLSACHLNEG